MGYLRRKLDRGRARLESREFAQEAEGPLDWPLWSQIGAAQPQVYLRFAVAERHEDSARPMGLFHASSLLESRERDPQVKQSLAQVLAWFNANLRVPVVKTERAIFYFKSDAREMIQHIWELALLLHMHDMDVHCQRVRQPGKLVYEDEHQVAAVPWSSSPEG